MDSYAGCSACKSQPDLEKRTALRPTPAVKLIIPKITTVRQPIDEPLFALLVGGVITSASGLIEEILCLRPSSRMSAGFEFLSADSKFSLTSDGASVSGSWSH